MTRPSDKPLPALPSHIKSHSGRPTDYRPEYCDMVIDALAEGYSLTAFAGMILVSRGTINDWMKAHSEFSSAVNRALPSRQKWWEYRLMTATRGGQVAAAIFALKNVAPDDWREVRSVKVEHSIASTLSDAQLYAIASGGHASEATTIDGDFVRKEG